MDSFRSVFFVAGLGFFLLAFLASAVLPVLTLSGTPYTSIEEIAADPTPEWRDMAERWPDAFKDAWGEEAWAQALLLPKRLDESPADPGAVKAATGAYAQAIHRGRDIYIAEGCWHCHSQYVRGVSKEEQRWGRVAMSEEYENELQRPPLWGTRRVGPDLSREWGRHSNDWHAAHLLDPRSTSPKSVMPVYPWFFRPNPLFHLEDEVRAQAATLALKEQKEYLRRELARTPKIPNRDGFSILAYIQWLGSWRPERPWDSQP
ncbi:MAG: cbb3-type cytochrome c oxidase subunit II [Planctomycetota bacterium]